MRRYYRYCRVVAQALFLLLFRGRVFGTRNVPQEGGVLLVCNHQSFLDPIFCGIYVKRPLWFMARDSLFSNPFFGRLIRSVHAIPVRRGEADLTAMKAIIAKLRENEGVCLFPEATRTTDGKIADVKAGFRLLSRKANAAIVPVLVDGAFECWPRHQKKPKLFSRISVWYGECVPADKVNAMKDHELSQYVTCTLRDMQKQCRLEKFLEPFHYDN